MTLRSKVKVPRSSLRYATHRLMVMHSHTKYHWPISKDKTVMAWRRKYYLKNNYLTLRLKVEIPRRSLRRSGRSRRSGRRSGNKNQIKTICLPLPLNGNQRQLLLIKNKLTATCKGNAIIHTRHTSLRIVIMYNITGGHPCQKGGI